jgi:hypothetical protein
MDPIKILFNKDDSAFSPDEVSERIIAFGDRYNDAVKEIIDSSRLLDKDGKTFEKCASRILSSFGMTRSGPFFKNMNENLRGCWDAIGIDLIRINSSIIMSGRSRNRYLLELGAHERDELIKEIWLITKRLLPFTMGVTSYGLVGASKILFSVLPEIVLPVDNSEWLHVFKTVDIGEVLHRMVIDIQEWEISTGRMLNELDHSKRLTTLPSVYNVMAMHARPNFPNSLLD